MTTTPVDALALSDVIWQALDGISGVNVFDGEVTTDPPLDTDGRVHAYAVFYPAAGWAHSVTLDAAPESLDWGFQVTCVGGDRTRCLWCVRKVRAALTGFRVDTPGGPVMVREVGDPGPVRVDQDVSPYRSYVPVDFTVTT